MTNAAEPWHKQGSMRSICLILLAILALAGPAAAEESPAKLRVGVFERPPLAFKDDDGHWSGVAVELWETVSQRLDLPFVYVEVPLDQITLKLHHGELDLAIGEIGVSAERERLIDFTQPFLVTSGAVALSREHVLSHWREIADGLTHHGLLLVLAAMMATLFVFSLLLWALERRAHQSHFGGKPIHGFGSALWFAAVTMTTVGYGDKTPQTPMGRFLAFVWMFLGILLVSAFTGSVASSITVARLNSSIDHMSDLSRFRNGVLDGSLAENLLSSSGVPFQKFASVTAGLEALSNGGITAFSGDALTLKFLVRRDFPDTLRVSTFPNTHITFAMASRPDFPRLQEINIAVIDIVESQSWQAAVTQWVGRDPAR